MNRQLTVKSIKPGFARIYYNATNSEGQRILYCLQEDFEDEFFLYRCSIDGEPDYPFKKIPPGLLEYPIGESDFVKKSREFLEALDTP